MDIGNSTRVAQKMTGITSAELARRLDTSPQNVTHIQNTRNPRIQRVKTLADIFDMEISKFIELE